MPTKDIYDAVRFLPESREVDYEEFTRLAVAHLKQQGAIDADKVAVDGLLLFLRANGLASATGIPPRVTRLPRRPEVRGPQRPVFTATDARTTPKAEVAFLRQQNQDLKLRVAELEAGR